jgi:hypothetical protein
LDCVSFGFLVFYPFFLFITPLPVSIFLVG